jgi:hypothetical protein
LTERFQLVNAGGAFVFSVGFIRDVLVRPVIKCFFVANILLNGPRAYRSGVADLFTSGGILALGIRHLIAIIDWARLHRGISCHRIEVLVGPSLTSSFINLDSFGGVRR